MSLRYFCMSTDLVNIFGIEKRIQIRIKKLYTPVGTAEGANESLRIFILLKQSMYLHRFLSSIQTIGGGGGGDKRNNFNLL